MCNDSNCSSCKWLVIDKDVVEVSTDAVRYKAVLYDVNGCVLVQYTDTVGIG